MPELPAGPGPPSRGLVSRFGIVLLTPARRLVSTWRTTRTTIARVPDVFEAILVLPALAQHLEAVKFSTATLPEMSAELARVQRNTAALPEMDRTLTRMAVMLDQIEANTAGVQELSEMALPLRNAAGRLADWRAQRPGTRRRLPG